MIEIAYKALRAGEAPEDPGVLLEGLVTMAAALTATRHPLGFVHVDLTPTVHASPGERLRLHIWDAPNAGSDDLGELHDHVWNLRSFVLKGALEDRTYLAKEDIAGPFWGSRIVYADHNTARPDRRYRLDLVEQRIVRRGELYTIPAGVIHRSEVLEVPSATLLLATDEPGLRERGPLVLRRSAAGGAATADRPRLRPRDLEHVLQGLCVP